MKEQISNSMLMAIIINMVYAKAIGVTQGVVARQSGGDMWMVAILSTLISLLVMWLTVVIIKRVPNKNIIEQAKILLGTWGEKILALTLLIFFFFAYGGVMITIVYHLMDYFLPDIPTYVFVIIVTIVGLYGMFKGIEVVARLALLGILSIIILNILLLLGSLSYFDIGQFFPVLRNGTIEAIVVTQHQNADWALATLMVAIILPIVKQPEKWQKYSAKGLITGGVFIVMWPILQVGVLSPEVTGQYVIACMQMARSAEIGVFLHRYELIMIVFFSISALVQVIMCLLCASICVKHIAGIKNVNIVVLPVAVLMGGLGYWIVRDHIWAMDWLTYYWPKIATPITFGVPIIMFIFGLIFKKKLKAQTSLQKAN